MPLKLKDKWVWDFWFVKDGADYHIFYLQADNSLQFEVFRHFNTSIGHAVSQDLCSWEILPDAIRPSTEPNRWDNYTTWTGSTIIHEGMWYLFYTGGTREERAWVQRIGLAMSKDGITWQKHGTQPLMVADPQWYEMLDLTVWHDHAWRDPYVVQNPETEQFYAYITARVKDGDPTARGVVAFATSSDLLNWTVEAPITPGGEFGQMEVPQVVQINNTWYLIHSSGADTISKRRTERLNNRLITATYYMMSDNMKGPFTYETEGCLSGDPHGSLYSGKLIQAPDGQWMYMAFRNFDEQGHFIGEIIDPIPIQVLENGQLELQTKS